MYKRKGLVALPNPAPPLYLLLIKFVIASWGDTNDNDGIFSELVDTYLPCLVITSLFGTALSTF